MKEMTPEEIEEFIKTASWFAFQLHCDRCGTRHCYQAPTPILIEEQLVKDGWTHWGDGLACPDCCLKTDTS